MNKKVFALLPLVIACADLPVDDEPPAPQEVRRAIDPLAASRGVYYDVATGEETLAREGPVDELSVPRPPPPNPAKVIGGDNRVLASDTTAWPARAMVKLNITRADGSGSMCSGTMVGRRSVLTAGHCVFDHDRGGWARGVVAIPGMDLAYEPFGRANSIAFNSVSGWTSDENNDYDYALITLDKHLGDGTGWLTPTALPASTLDGLNVTIAGYPGDRDNGARQYVHAGPVKNHDSTMFYYDIDTAGGDSGAGVRGTSTHEDAIVGVHTGWYFFEFNTYNGATRLTSARVSQISGWIAARAGLSTMTGDTTQWTSLGETTFTPPAVVSCAEGRYDVFIRATDGTVRQKTRTLTVRSQFPSFGWTNLGGATTDGITAVTRAANTIDLFARGTDGALWTRRWTGSAWSPASSWLRLGGSLSGQPIAVVTDAAAGRVDLFARDANGVALWGTLTGSTWSGFQSLGLKITHQTAVSYKPGRIDLVVRNAATGEPWHRVYEGGQWEQTWSIVGGWMAGDVTLVSPVYGELELFVRDGAGEVWNRRWTRGAGWRGWTSLGGNTNDMITVAHRSLRFDIYIRDARGLVFSKRHDRHTGWEANWRLHEGDVLGPVTALTWGSVDTLLVTRSATNATTARVVY